jgi:hypothetical protein
MVVDGGDCAALMDAVATTAGMPAMPNAKSAKRTGRQTERVMMFIGMPFGLKIVPPAVFWRSRVASGKDPCRSSVNFVELPPDCGTLMRVHGRGP